MVIYDVTTRMRITMDVLKTISGLYKVHVDREM